MHQDREDDVDVRHNHQFDEHFKVMQVVLADTLTDEHTMMVQILDTCAANNAMSARARVRSHRNIVRSKERNDDDDTQLT